MQLGGLEYGGPSAERALDRARQVPEIDRLDQILEGAPLHAERGGRRVIDRREHQDGEAGLEVEELRNQVEPARARHPDVEQHRGHFLPPEQLERLRAAAGGRDLVALEGQKLLEGRANWLVIVHHEHRDRPL
jgi:hypothetical protein